MFLRIMSDGLNTVDFSKKDILSSLSFRKFFKFLVVGIIATAIHYLIYWILKQKMNISIAYSIGYGLSLICNLYLTCVFTFKKKATLKNGVGFGFAHIINYLLHLLFLNIFLLIGIPSNWAPIPVFCIVVPINFLLVRYVFR